VRWRLRPSLLLILSLAVLPPLALLLVYLALRAEPEFYRRALTGDPAAMRAGSEELLRQAAALEGAVQREGRWELLVTAEQINGWLAVDLPKNHPRALPPEMSDPRVDISGGVLTVACRYHQSGVNCVLSLSLRPYLTEGKTLAVQVVGARVGILPAPLGRVVDEISKSAGQLNLQLRWQRGDDGNPVALLSMPDDADHHVVLETIRLEDGKIYIAGASKRGKK
jgi:hypothetical protein